MNSLTHQEAFKLMKASPSPLIDGVSSRIIQDENGVFHEGFSSCHLFSGGHFRADALASDFKEVKLCANCSGVISFSAPGIQSVTLDRLTAALKYRRSVEAVNQIDFRDPEQALKDLEEAVASKEAYRYLHASKFLKPLESPNWKVHSSNSESFVWHLRTLSESYRENDGWGVMLIENVSWSYSSFHFRNMVPSRKEDGVFAQLCLRVFSSGKNPFDEENPSGVYYAPMNVLKNVAFFRGRLLDGVQLQQVDQKLNDAQLEIISSLAEESNSLKLTELVELATCISPNNNIGG